MVDSKSKLSAASRWVYGLRIKNYKTEISYLILSGFLQPVLLLMNTIR